MMYPSSASACSASGERLTASAPSGTSGSRCQASLGMSTMW